MEPSPAIQPLIDGICARFESREVGVLVLTDLAVLVAAADETIDEAEMVALTASLQALIGAQLAPMLVRHVVGESRERIGSAGVEASAKRIGKKLAACGAAEDGLRFALLIASSSEGISEVERARVALVAGAAGVAVDRVEALVSEQGKA
ncbi:hypothetical protein [Polyangium aurulentum]|uniref:hypothetical protein n=1 Tax=Polyangium aurulentum TaxID=2567896 RepID=UPI0010AEEAA9|nr:hypothetical protein [Polyangium aurulentum]UQA60173.1 hypothetical protein E8A73_006750 [Polyangium aurulentum]